MFLKCKEFFSFYNPHRVRNDECSYFIIGGGSSLISVFEQQSECSFIKKFDAR